MAYLKAVHKSQFKGRLCVSTFYHSVATLKRKCFRIYKPAVIREAGVADNATYVKRTRGSDERIVTSHCFIYMCVFVGIFIVSCSTRLYCVYVVYVPPASAGQSEECMVLDRCGGIMVLHKLLVYIYIYRYRMSV